MSWGYAEGGPPGIGREQVKIIVDSLECQIDDISLGALVCPLVITREWLGPVPCGLAVELCPFILATTEAEPMAVESGWPGLEPEDMAGQSQEQVSGWTPGPPVLLSLSQRLELMRRSNSYSPKETEVDQDLVEKVGAMVTAYLEMGCVEEPESLECYYSEYSLFLLAESEELAGGWGY